MHLKSPRLNIQSFTFPMQGIGNLGDLSRRSGERLRSIWSRPFSNPAWLSSSCVRYFEYFSIASANAAVAHALAAIEMNWSFP